MGDKNETTPPEMPPSQTLMPGLHFVAGKPWSVKVDSIDVLTDALGEELTRAFAGCASACDRLISILDCMVLNDKAHTRDTSAATATT